ncbi:MAG: hypothetical protein V3V10_04805 [Planctomycetota bacterium]
MKNLTITLSLLLFLAVPVGADSAEDATKPEVKKTRASTSKLGLTAYESDHYRLETDADKSVADEYLKIVESEWPQLVEFFGKEPKLRKRQKLRIYYLTTQELWHAKFKEDGVGIPFGAGGYYTPKTSAVYFYRQPTVYNTRQLLIHEVMHQFHYLACCKNRSPKNTWYTEGIVEHLSRHNWNGETLEMGAVPLVTLADYPAKALQLFEHKDYSLADMVNNVRESARPEAWALVHYIYSAEEGRYLVGWNKFRSKMDAGSHAKDWFKRLVASPDGLQPKIKKWLKEEQEPFKYLWNEWEARGFDEVIGWADNITAGIVCRENIDNISCTMSVPEKGDWAGGILLDYVNNKDYTVGHIRSNGNYTVSRMTQNGWAIMRTGKGMKAINGKIVLRAVRKKKTKKDDGGVEYWVQGKLIETIPVNGKQMGYCLENGRLTFTGLDWN